MIDAPYEEPQERRMATTRNDEIATFGTARPNTDSIFRGCEE